MAAPSLIRTSTASTPRSPAPIDSSQAGRDPNVRDVPRSRACCASGQSSRDGARVLGLPRRVTVARPGPAGLHRAVRSTDSGSRDQRSDVQARLGGLLERRRLGSVDSAHGVQTVALVYTFRMPATSSPTAIMAPVRKREDSFDERGSHMRRIVNRLVARSARGQLDDSGRRSRGTGLRIGRRAAVRTLPVAVAAMAVLPSCALAAAWRIEAAVNPAGLTNATLVGVSCLSATSCLVVGDGNTDQPTYSGSPINPTSFGEIWNGTAWIVAPIASARGEHPSLTSVSCVSAAFCMAAGSTQGGGDLDYGPAVIAGKPLAEIWNGITWTPESIPTPAGSASSGLSGVACLSTRFCIAVGSTTPAGKRQAPLAEIWNGTTWRDEPTIAAGTILSELSAVSCVATNACTAVGTYGFSPGFNSRFGALIERWDGHRFVRQSASAYPSTDAWATGLSGVSCPTRSSCIAVGSTTPLGNGIPEPVAERWSDGRWTLVTGGLPEPVGANDFRGTLPIGARFPTVGQLYGASCTSPSACEAAGEDKNSDGDFHAFAATWNGSRWTSQASGLTSAPLRGFGLLAVSCIAATTCTTVGASNPTGNAFLPLAASDAPAAPPAVS